MNQTQPAIGQSSPPKNAWRPYLNRFFIVFGLTLLFTAVFNEGAYLLQKEKHDRAPQTIQLVIPAGTAAQVDAGLDAPSIPAEMVFVIGDVLEVKNEDTTNHSLGPLWIPAGSSARLKMETADKLAFSCSFQTSQYLGVDVRQPTTLGTRMTALILATPTMTALLFIYGLLVFPIDKKRKPERSSASMPGQEKP